MSTVRSRRLRLLAATALIGGALVVAPTLAATAQAETDPLWLQTTWKLYAYQNGYGLPLYGETETLNSDAASLASSYAACTQPNCFYLIPSLPGSTGTKLFFVKTGWRGLPNSEAEAQSVASAVEIPAGSTLLNSYYNWGGFGTATKGDTVYTVLILTHYTGNPPGYNG